MSALVTLRLWCATFWVDVRVREFDGRFIASADTPDGPTVGTGLDAMAAIEDALQPFSDDIDELLASLPQAHTN